MRVTEPTRLSRPRPNRGIGFALTALLLTLAVGCAPGDDTAASQESNIVEGRIAHGLSEAVHVNAIDEYGPSQSCSGVLIAPRVVVTAAHCIVGSRAWGIYAPFAGGQAQVATQAEMYDWYDYQAAGDDYPWDRHDVGVVFLEEAIELEAYPVIATDAVSHGDFATIVGRVRNGFNSPDWLFASEPVVVLHEWPNRLAATGRYYTVPQRTTERGDSGGPVYAHDDAEDEATRTLIGLVSTAHNVLRVERVAHWLAGYTDAP